MYPRRKSKQLFLFLVVLAVPLFAICQSPESNMNINPSNPILNGGSNFLSIFQQYYKQGRYSEMLKLTSQESIEKITRDTLLRYFERMEFGYRFEIMSFYQEGRFYKLNYQAYLNLTPIVVRINLIVENDSAKIILSKDIIRNKIFLID